MTLRIFTYSA